MLEDPAGNGYADGHEDQAAEEFAPLAGLGLMLIGVRGLRENPWASMPGPVGQAIGRSPDTVKAYAHDLKDFFELPADHSPAPPGALTGCRRVRLAWYSRQVSQTSTASKMVSAVRPIEKCTAVIRYSW